MGISGSCHCGAVRIEVPAAPEWVAECNCSICRKRGTLTAYFKRSEVTIEGETAGYETGDRLISMRHCPACACAIHWEAIPGTAERADLPDEVREALRDRTGINARLLDGFTIEESGPALDGRPLEVRFFDNA